MNPTDPPHYREPSPSTAKPPWNPRAVRAFWLALASVLLVPALFGLLMLVANATRDRWPWLGSILLVALVLGSISSAVLGFVGARAGLGVRREVPAYPVAERGRGLGLAAIPLGILGVVMQFGGFLFACLVLPVIGRGRQVRHLGRPALPPVTPGDAWSSQALDLGDLDPSVRAALAARWRENGRTEHASVAAFARLTLDLLALGAPPPLVAAAQRDALDEVQHTEACFSLARALDGRALGPGAFPAAAQVPSPSRVRVVALATLAVDSLLDGAMSEGVSARLAAALAQRCEDGPIRAALKVIAADEGRHAAHGWDVVAWCLAEGGTPVARALQGAVRGLSTRVRPRLATLADDGAWERWGIHGHALEAEAYASALADVGRRVQRLTAVDARAAA